MAASLSWRTRGVLIVHECTLALRAANLWADLRSRNRELDKALNELGGEINDDLRKTLTEMLRNRRAQADKVTALRESLLHTEAGRKGPLVSITAWFLDGAVESMLDDIETLELSVDQEVREHLVREIRKIAASS